MSEKGKSVIDIIDEMASQKKPEKKEEKQDKAPTSKEKIIHGLGYAFLSGCIMTFSVFLSDNFLILLFGGIIAIAAMGMAIYAVREMIA